jgi:hypothetical protein
LVRSNFYRLRIFQLRPSNPTLLPLNLERAKYPIAVLCRPVNPSKDQT